MIVLICGLPGSGKTSLAKELIRRTGGTHLNGDDARKELSSDLGFSIKDRKEQARRLGAVARILSNQGQLVIVDFINPTEETRSSFGTFDCFVWVDRIKSSRFKDTDGIWEDPENFDIKISFEKTIKESAEEVISFLSIYDWTKPTTLMLGRYQPWHEGHQALKNEAHKRTDQVLVGVRNTHGTSEKDPLPYDVVVKNIEEANKDNLGLVMKLPNITNIVYGRDVGYKIEHIDLSPEIKAISATEKRKELGL